MNDPSLLSATILIVDDNSTNLRVLSEYLTAQDYEVLIAEDGEAAVEQTQFSMPDLVLLDVMMPGIDGFETCKRLKEDPRTKNIPVIFLTANTDTKNVVKGFSVGAVDYIGKPLQQEEVTARVRSHIAIRRLQRELQGEVVARRDAEESLREIEEDLRRANAEKDRKVSDLARELKVPISEIAELCGKLTSNLPETASPDLKAIVQALIDKTNMLEKTVLGRLEAS